MIFDLPCLIYKNSTLKVTIILKRKLAAINLVLLTLVSISHSL